jgi:hypothetical protein
LSIISEWPVNPKQSGLLPISRLADTNPANFLEARFLDNFLFADYRPLGQLLVSRAPPAHYVGDKY